jgi:hypothetical protein
MKRTTTMITAAVFSAALALPAFAQIGAGIAGNGTVGQQDNRTGANADIQNSDAEMADPSAPAAAANATERRTETTREHSKTVQSESNSGVGANAGVNPSAGNVGANANTSGSTDNSATGGY